MNRHKRYPPEVRERAVRLVLEHQENYHSQWTALTSIADKIGCTACNTGSGRTMYPCEFVHSTFSPDGHAHLY